MYMIRSAIVGTEETITYPVTVSVIQDIQKFLGLNNAIPTRVGDGEPIILSKDTHSQNVHIPDIPNEELRVEYTDEPTGDYDVSLLSAVPRLKPFYLDNDVRASMKPLLAKRTTTFTITYYSKSKSGVTASINRLRSRSALETRQTLHDLEYHYYIPEVLIELLMNINTLKNNYPKPPVDFDTYLNTTFDDRGVIVNDESGNPLKIKLAIREVQECVLGTIDTDVYNIKKEFDSDTNRWFFTLDYIITYEVPTQLLTTYPITVYNQPIAKKFRITNNPKIPTTSNRTFESDGLHKLTDRTDPILRLPDTCYYLRIPVEDTLVLPQPIKNYVRLFSTISILDINQPTLLFYLDELPYITFKPDILKLIKLEAPRLGQPYSSIFYLDIYNHDHKLYQFEVLATVVTENINGVPTERVKLTTSKPLGVKGSYRVCFNILADLSVMHTGPKTLLKDNIAKVDAMTNNNFSVIDTVLSVFDLDVTALKPHFGITNTTTSYTIAENISDTLPYSVFTKQRSLILTAMLDRLGGN